MSLLTFWNFQTSHFITDLTKYFKSVCIILMTGKQISNDNE